jgi:CotS family spore coat protein
MGGNTMNISRFYPMKYKKIVEDEDRYIINTAKSTLILKPIDVKESEIIASVAIIDYVVQKGFKNILSIKRNIEGKPYTKHDGKIYILSQSHSSDKLKLRSEENALLMAEMLANFHNAAEGFIQPVGVKVKVNWGKTMERYRALTCKLERYIDYVNDKEKQNQFEEYTKTYLPYLLKRAKRSMKILRSAKYLMALEKSMKLREVCINGVSNNTVIIDDGNLIITKIFDLGYNMVEEDIADLVKKLIIETEDKSLINPVIDKYSQIRGLNEASKDIIKALISYPVDSIKIIGKYMKDMEDSDELLEKLKSYIANEQRTDILEV